MQASFPVREIGTMLTLLHARYELEDLLRMDNFQGQDHLQEPSDLRDRKRWCFFFPTGSGDATEKNAPAYMSAYGDATRGICALHSGPGPVRLSSPQSIGQSPIAPH